MSDATGGATLERLPARRCRRGRGGTAVPASSTAAQQPAGQPPERRPKVGAQRRMS